MKIHFFVGALLLLAVLVGSGAGATSYTGSLSSESLPPGIIGTGEWTPATMTWTVSLNNDGSWHYDYVLSVYRQAVSHLIIEASLNFTTADIFNVQGPVAAVTVGWHNPGPGNPSLPESIYGIKFDGNDGTTYHISFDSLRVPVWGDFYSKDGKNGGEMNAVWNVGLTSPDTDPSAPPSNGSVDYHILVPDTVIPEPSSLAALGAALVAGLPLVRRRLRRIER